MNSIKSKHTWTIRHRRKYQLLYKSEIPRIFTFSASRRVIILANNLPCFYAMFPLIADTTYTERKHKFIPNSLMTSNKHLTYPLLDKVPGMEETEFTEGGTKRCCLHWFWFMKDFCQEFFVLIFQTKGGSTSWSCNVKLMGENMVPTPKKLSYCLNYKIYPNWRTRIT